MGDDGEIRPREKSFSRFVFCFLMWYYSAKAENKMFYQRFKSGMLNIKDNAGMILFLGGLYLLFRAFFWVPEQLGEYIALAVGFFLGSVMFHFAVGAARPRPKLDVWADSDAVLEKEVKVVDGEHLQDIQAEELEEKMKEKPEEKVWRM